MTDGLLWLVIGMLSRMRGDEEKRQGQSATFSYVISASAYLLAIGLFIVGFIK